MLEYGIKDITTNPTLITKSDEIIRLIDKKNYKTRAFVLPVSYESFIEEIVKEMEFKKWIDEKKEKIQNKIVSENMDDLMLSGIDSVNEYLEK